MNKQSNVYTIIYIVVLVVVVGAALAMTAMSLKSRQQDNADADKMRQILASVRITPEKSEVIQEFGKYITEQFIVNANGERVEGDAFKVSVAEQYKKADVADCTMPVYKCTLADGSVKYILAAYGGGLWGPIWGYVSVDSDGSTIYGAFFDHQGETPGLGAEIAKPAFSNQFEGKQLFKDGKFVPIEVIKKGQQPKDANADYVDGISGGTITSQGVSAMLNKCLKPYEAFLKNLSNE
mgnify:CR=1 FL=1